MKSSKVDFISNLLTHKNIRVAEKERLFMLTREEVKKLGEHDVEKINELVKRIEKLEGKGNVSSISSNTGNPKHVADFMSLFNKRDGLKYLTHDYDENGDFKIDTFLIESNKVFTEISKKISIPPSLWRIVQQFAFESKQTGWTSLSEDYEKYIQVKTGWSSKELCDWSKNNHLHPIRNKDYKKMINDFRRITRIESPNLDSLIKKIIDTVFKDIKDDFIFDTKDLDKADFYTHVGNLKGALECIFEEIKERTDTDNKRKVKIEYTRDALDDYFIRKIIISHYNSYPSKELSVLLREWLSLEKGNMGKIGQKLQGYCYWSVITCIEGKPVKINILRDKSTPEYEIYEQNDVIGFTHELTFYYK